MKTKLSQKELESAYSDLVERANFDIDFIVLTLGASVICTLGLIINSTSVILGSMVIAPFLWPILALSASLSLEDLKASRKSFLSLFAGSLVIIISSSLIALFFPFNASGSEVVRNLNADPLIYFLIAFFSGLTGTFAFFWPKMIEAMTGIALSAAVVPPLCIFGIALVSQKEFIYSSFLIVILNIIGILLGSIITQLLLRWRNHEVYCQ